ncbi:uncharacterized protein SCHCODRAFT_02585602 [Schizophyllum commune H4-8]|nr:uncharacterized protein SCHCODRAFT_02585602 [Schizophyllum commune H4-8]KAI5889343.1 hypothetical protein SCHCODRAFT_02585602 [Schizophyllum commune H4-8]
MGKVRKGARTTPSVDGTGCGQRATGKKTTDASAPYTLRRSSRIQEKGRKVSGGSPSTPQLAPNDVVTLPASSQTSEPPPQATTRYHVRFDEPGDLRQTAPDDALSDVCSSAPSPLPTLANYDPDYIPPKSFDEDDGSTTSRESTPLAGNIACLASRPGHQDLIDKSPLGQICVVTLGDNNEGIVQDCHQVDRAQMARPKVAKGFETIMVLEPGTFDIDCPENRVFLDANTHITMDNGHIVLLPVVQDLRRLLDALQKKVLNPIEGQEESPQRGPNGFTHHKDVFPNDIRPFHIAVLSTCRSPIHRKLSVDSIEDKTYYAPYDEPFPIIDLHCSPYFVVWKAYKTLQKEHVHAPAHLSQEEELVRQIGDLMWKYGLSIPPTKD